MLRSANFQAAFLQNQEIVAGVPATACCCSTRAHLLLILRRVAFSSLAIHFGGSHLYRLRTYFRRVLRAVAERAIAEVLPIPSNVRLQRYIIAASRVRALFLLSEHISSCFFDSQTSHSVILGTSCKDVFRRFIDVRWLWAEQ